MSMPRVAIRCDRVCGRGVDLLGIAIVDIAVLSSVFFLLVFWFSEASSILGFRYCNVCGVLLVMHTDLWDIAFEASVEFRSNDNWRELPPRSG